MTTDVGVPEDIRDMVKGTITGMHQFIDSEVVPLEQELKPILTDERRFFHEEPTTSAKRIDGPSMVFPSRGRA